MGVNDIYHPFGKFPIIDFNLKVVPFKWIPLQRRVKKAKVEFDEQINSNWNNITSRPLFPSVFLLFPTSTRPNLQTMILKLQPSITW